VPDWDINLRGSQQGAVVRVDQERQEQRGMVRGLARGVVGSLPVVWRLKDWI
jgi:hypothetical protein